MLCWPCGFMYAVSPLACVPSGVYTVSTVSCWIPCGMNVVLALWLYICNLYCAHWEGGRPEQSLCSTTDVSGTPVSLLPVTLNKYCLIVASHQSESSLQPPSPSTSCHLPKHLLHRRVAGTSSSDLSPLCSIELNLSSMTLPQCNLS